MAALIVSWKEICRKNKRKRSKRENPLASTCSRKRESERGRSSLERAARTVSLSLLVAGAEGPAEETQEER